MLNASVPPLVAFPLLVDIPPLVNTFEVPKNRIKAMGTVYYSHIEAVEYERKIIAILGAPPSYKIELLTSKRIINYIKIKHIKI